jgi:hypothetical protein
VLLIAEGRVVNLAGYIHNPSKENTIYPDSRWVKEVTQEEVLEVLKNFEPDVQQLLQVLAF